MKLKLILLIVGIAVIGSSIVIAVIQSRARPGKRNPANQGHDTQSQLGPAISNYNETFKLNTNAALWPEPQRK
jgi:hypothetical protein